MKDLGLYSSEIEAMIDFWNDLKLVLEECGGKLEKE